tara:strand:- start:129 stop:569 length:441 start_codon:yes stop_codon:yes gene_type:complete
MKLIKGFNYKKILSLIWQQDGSPFVKAKGTAVGVFSGCFPFFGFQTLIGVSLAKVLNGNLVLAAIGTWISNPVTYIPLYILNYKIGSFIFNDNQSKFIDPSLIKDQFWQQGSFFISRIILGSSVVGLILGFFSGILTYYFFKLKKR